MPKLVFKLSETQSLDFPLAGDHVRLGRNAANDIVIDNSWISSFHAEFRLQPGGVTELRDLKSSNGTTVNGKRIESALLTPGDTVSFGQLEAIFDPPAEGGGLNGSADKTPAREKVSVPSSPMKATRGEKPSLAGNERTELINPLPPVGVTEPLPAAGLPKRIVVPAPVQATALVPSSEGTLADSRRELQQTHLQISSARSEIKALSETLEALRRDQESQEQSRAQSKLQGEREALELRTRLEKLQEEIEKTESSAAEMAQARTATLAQEEKEITARLTALQSTEETAAAAIQAQEEKLAALRDEETGLTAISAKLKSALLEVDEAMQRKTAALAEAAASEGKAASLQEELVRIQGEVDSARTDRAAQAAAIAAAETNLKQMEAQAAAAAVTFETRETELSALIGKLEDSRREVEDSVASLAETEKAASGVSASHAQVTAALEAAESRLAEQHALLEAAGGKLSELDTAKARLVEIETAIAESTAKALTAKETADEEENKKAVLLKAIASTEQEHTRQQASLTKVASELTALKSQHEAAAAELSSLTGVIEAKNAAAQEAADRLGSVEKSIATASERLVKVQKEGSAAKASLSEHQSQIAAGGGELAALTKQLEDFRRQIVDRESAVTGLDQQKATLTANVQSLTAEVESLSARANQLGALQSSLAELNAQISEAGDAISGKRATLAQLEMQAAAAGLSAKQALEAQAGAARAAEELALHQKKLAAVTDEITAMTEKRAAASRTLFASQAELQSLTERVSAARAQAAMAEGIRVDMATLQKQADELKTAVSRLEERKQSFADAPDPTWGTVHAMAKGIIKQIDLLDDLLTHMISHSGSREAIEQMSIFRAGLMDILTEYTVAPYQMEPGLTVDVAARKRIQIVESREDDGKGTRILKNFRPGYVCSNGSVGVQTLLRKAEVSILLGR